MSSSSSSHLETHVTVNDALMEQYHDELVGAIDQGTSSSRFLLFSKSGQICASAQKEHTQHYPRVGWHEHDPLEIWRSVVECMEKCVDAASKVLLNKKKKKGKKTLTIKCIGITNQRETTLCWNAKTGKPYYNAIVWDCLRTTNIAHHVANGDIDRLRDKTGLPLASYFAGTKVKWLLDHASEELQNDWADAEKRKHVRFGTIDTWLVYQLTGKPATINDTTTSYNVGGLFLTDVSNASRWLFLNLETTQWDASLVEQVTGDATFPIETALPKIHSSSELYGHVTTSVESLKDVPIASILGDQQAALFGQACFEPGMAKNTYGTGLFLMMHTGPTKVPSTHGLLTTIAHQLGGRNGDGTIQYALEGSVSHSGSTIQWLRDQMNILDDAKDSEAMASQLQQGNNDGCYLVPAFAGLFAPHWRSDARACWVGLTATHHKGHLVRAALEATAYQTKEVLDAMQKDSDGVKLKSLKVDGGATQNKWLMQFQADVLADVQVVQPVVMETTSIGAAFAAGLAVGVWTSLEEIQQLWAVQKTYEPNMDDETRERNWKGWQKAVTKSMGWVEEEDEDDTKKRKKEQEETRLEHIRAVATAALDEADAAAASAGHASITLFLVAVAALAGGFLLGKRHT